MNKKYTCLIIIILVVVSCAAFGRIAGNDFINFDDNLYITDNNHVQSGFSKGSMRWAATAVVSSNWHPLTMLSHMLDWSLFRANAGGHHLVSLLWHIGAVIFLFLFLNKTTNRIWPSAFAAALFALHPLRVESIAWASERKDVLSMFFAMACLWVYAFYVQKKNVSRYLLCLTLFALALMSKPMMVTLPFVLMLLDYWPLRRWPKALNEQGKGGNSVRGLILEKVPFICLTIISSILTFWAQSKEGSVASFKIMPFTERFSNAIVSYAAYLWKTIWPFNLAVFYPYKFSLPLWKILLSGIILIFITLTVLYYIRKLPFLFVGWFIYLGTLVPVIGIVQVGLQSTADRYTYFPSIGIAVMLAWGIPFLFKKEEMRKEFLFPVAIAYLIVLLVLTWHQCGYWKNSKELWKHALEATEDNYIAHSYIAHFMAEKRIFNSAIYHYNKAISIKSQPLYCFAGYYLARGNIYCKSLNQYKCAIDDFNEAIRLNPNYIDAYNNRGLAYYNLGNYQLAIADFNKIIGLKPDYANAYNNRGLSFLLQGINNLGCHDLQKACELHVCIGLDFAKKRGICR